MARTMPIQAHSEHTSGMPTHSKQRVRRLLGSAALLGLLASQLQAGTLSGTVLNKNTQRYLERATVQLVGTPYQTLTGKDGSFQISGIPAGNYQVVVDYTDLDQQTKSVTVGETDSATANFEMTASEVYKMEQFVVSSPIEGTSYAVNQQRRAESTRSINSIDAFIDQTTGNPGEFLKNVEGIQMDYSQNEPQTIRVRGFDPNLTMVTMDGNKIASATSSSASRAVQIDQLSIAAIESVEVFKAPIPSMSANAIGGAVNFTTKSAFEQKGRRAFIQMGVNMDSNDFSFDKSNGPGHGESAQRRIYPVGRFQYSDSFLNNRLGVVFSTGYDHTNQLGSSTTQNVAVAALPGSQLPALPTAYTLDNVIARRGAFSVAPNRQLRIRSDISLNTDFKVNEFLSAFLKTTYSDYHSNNRNHSITWTPSSYSADSTLTKYSATGTVTQGSSVFDKYTKSWQINPGLKFRRNDWKADATGGISKSTNHYKNPNNFTGVNLLLDGNAGWNMETPTQTDVPTALTQTSGLDCYNLGNYKPNQAIPSGGVLLANSGNFVNTNKRDSADTDYSVRFDLQRDFHTRIPFYLKGGFAYNETIYEKMQEQRRWYWAGDDGLIGTSDDNTTAANLGRFAEPVAVHQNIPGWNLKEPSYFSTVQLYDYWQQHPQVLVENQAYAAQQKVMGHQKVNEQVRAGYLMANATIKKLNILTGLRVERTDVDTLGYRVLPTPAGLNSNSLEGIKATYIGVKSGSGYTSDPFPYLHLRYEIMQNLQLRASYTEAIGRPALSDMIPSGVTINDNAFTINASNRAGLLPQRSQNYDFSAEFYTKSSGQLTAGFFKRDVSKYITTQSTQATPSLLNELGLGSEYQGYMVSTKSNLGSASWYGFEMSLRQSLRDLKFLPGFMKGVSVWANYTRIAKMEGDYGTPGAKITKLANVVPELINAGISYRTPSGKLFVQLSTNYQAKKPTTNLPAASTSAQMMSFQEPYQFWNLESSYRITDKLKLTCTARNLFSERPKFSNLGIITNTQQATGVAYLFAMKYDF